MLSLSSEEALWAEGYPKVAGVDEAGRGPLAGPVYAAACILYPSFHLPSLDDSKKLSEKQREILFTQLTTDPLISYAIASVDAPTIDQINILRATLLAMEQALSALTPLPDYILVDGNILPPVSRPARAVISGDRLIPSIAAASILAKVSRDRWMRQLDREWPQYGFAKHKGYGTEGHRAALLLHGPSPLHRKTFLKKIQFQSLL